ncbi:MAG TPA: hypothetical protein VFT45_13160 [Longimicrobium sp.]|nr:hypothetical protein [Longimicrobium sp.]
MIGLGVLGDQPPNPYQPTLPDGIHLRWGFARDLGFPWHGFHLFRRPARVGIPWCLSSVTGGLKKGTLDEREHHTVIGRLSSDTNLVLTEEFAPGARAEFALDGRAVLRFDLPEGELARRVDLRIGFRAACLDAETIVSFPGGPDQLAGPTPDASVFRPNPLALGALTFTVKGDGNQLPAQTRFDAIATTSGQLVGLACGYGLIINLPASCSSVELLVTRTLTAAKFEAFNAGNQKVASASTRNPANQPETIQITGDNIVRIEIRTLRNTAFLHRICLGRSGEGNRVSMTAFSGSTPVRTVTVSGAAGQIVSASLAGDAITAVAIGPGPAALLDLCYVPVAQDATQGWEPLRGFPNPMGLPVSHPDYPCSAASPASLLTQRVRYALPAEWSGASFAELHQQLVELVEGGPAGAPMADRVFSAPPPASTGSDPPAPQLSKFHLLDMVLLGALHPALAQLAGLYWVDRTAVANVPYDYLVVADHTGIGQRSAATVLAVLKLSGFAQLDGWIVFNQRAAPAPTLPPPGALQAYELPGGGSFPDVHGALPQHSNTAGLRWELGRDAAGALLPDRAVMYLVWRVGLGNAATPAPGGMPALVTKVPSNGKPKPVMATDPRLPKGAVPQRPPGWPADPLHYIDRNLPDGWYRYQVSGIDLFGRHSAAGPPAQLRLLDRVAPPMPTGVEAYALDPLDPYLQKDGAYQAWFAGVGPSVVGLRVRWRWTRAHQRQAPDTAEFRIYYHPGALPPDDRDQPVKWQDRCFAVGYASNVQVDPQSGDRIYEVFIPPSTAPNPASIPLDASLAEPVVYAHVGVSAADGKLHTADARTGGDWGGRPGNEGSVGPPAKIYRVWRALPAAPAALMNDARYYASPADYHDRSFFTYRWKPEPHLALHVFRAMDDALFQADWARRPAAALNASQPDLFPPGWNQAGRQQVASELNHLNTLPADAEADPEAVALAAKKAKAYYGKLSDAALRVLAGLPGNEGAFVQLTLHPLKPGDAANANRRGPDNADELVIDSSLRAYVDTLDGRGTNRYFYRAALVDEAHNLGPLGPPTPPVYLPNVVPPRAPVLTKVLGGDRLITLRWASNREPDLAEYRVYRTGREESTRDVRLMELVHTEPVPPGDPATRPAEVVWDDTPVPAKSTFYYRITATDTAGNVSAPSAAVGTRAFDHTPPPPPAWSRLEWVYRDEHRTEHPISEEPPQGAAWQRVVALRWETAERGAALLQRREATRPTWEQASGWLDPTGYDGVKKVWVYGAYDMAADPAAVSVYRIQVESDAGNLSDTFDERQLGPA